MIILLADWYSSPLIDLINQQVLYSYFSHKFGKDKTESSSSGKIAEQKRFAIST